jgi:heme ABC exporter ATP-binding subunit CcmA
VCLLGRFPALAGVDLDVDAGEIVLLAGPNGAGKTTLLRLIAGLVPLYSGEASVFDTDLTVDRRAPRRRLALVGHETFCYDDLTVRENLRFVARASGGDGATVGPTIDRLGLAPVAELTHRKLSAGQRRRLALGTAIVRDPELLLLDEPHAGLDADGREVLHEIVAAAPAEGRTVLMASHELDLARALATREVRVESGQTTNLSPNPGPLAPPIAAPTDGPKAESR